MIFLIIFLLVSDPLHASVRSLKNAFDQNINSELVRSFARLMTMKGDQCIVPDKNHNRAFMNQHWLNQWHFFRPHGAKGVSVPHFVRFHEILSERFGKNGTKHQSIKIPSKGQSLRSYKTADSGFVDGHLVDFSDLEFKFPVVLVNMYGIVYFKT